MNKTPIDPKEIRKHRYMATRYLQLQHRSRTGLTSGDGRSIWNGVWRNDGKEWDITSCGTGVTRLSPGFVDANKPIRSGSNEYSYGNGMAETNEGLEAAILSEIFHRRGLPTERVLGIIEFKKGLAINVRVGQNLIRPAHIFLHLKQERRDRLKAMVDYVIDRQIKNKSWAHLRKKENAYDQFLLCLAKDFGSATAHFEDEYIFQWMEWDGDNMLLNGGVLDYGAVRQFGLYHHHYRYDDVDRYSTSIAEQKVKARYVLQTFAQAIDYIKTGKKKSLEKFRKSPALLAFDHAFTCTKQSNLLKKIGFNQSQQKDLLEHMLPAVEHFRKIFHHFEKTAAMSGPVKVADGVNRNAVYCMRDLLRELPKIYFNRVDYLPAEKFLKLMLSKYADRAATRLSPQRAKLIYEFQQAYIDLIAAVSKNHELKPVLLEVTMRSSVVNKYDRITGNALIAIVDTLLSRSDDLSVDTLGQSIEHFVHYQTLLSDRKNSLDRPKLKVAPSYQKILFSMLRLAGTYRHDI